MKLSPTIPMSKPMKLPATPKIASVHVTPISGGMKVQHNMTHGPKPVPFVFADPAKVMSHLKRIQTSAWRQPDRNYAGAVNKTLNLNE